MDQDLRTLLDSMTSELALWLDKPSETGAKIAQVREQMGELGDALTGDTLKAAMKALDEAEGETRRRRQREAADAIAELCRPLGVRLEARDAPKKSGRKPGSGRTVKKKVSPKQDG